MPAPHRGNRTTCSRRSRPCGAARRMKRHRVDRDRRHTRCGCPASMGLEGTHLGVPSLASAKHCTPQRGTRRIVRLPWSPHRMVVGPSASLRRFRFPTFSAPRVAIGERARPLTRVLGPDPSRRGKWIGYRRRNRRPCALYWIHRPLPLARPVQPSIGGPDSATI